MSRVRRCTCIFTALSALLVPRAFAQATGGPDPAKVRIRIGPVAVIPTLALANFGFDNNVFNESDQANPKRDFTMTIAPAADLWLKAGPTWFAGTIKEDLVYYNTYASERSINSRYKASWLIPLNRITVNLAGDYVSVRDRPGFEIDARSQRTEIGYDGSVELRATGKTSFGVRGTRRYIAFDSVATFAGANLRDALNRTATGGSLLVRHQLTPLTSLTLTGSRDEDRFEFSPLRDSNSTAIAGGVEFKPSALIKGSASFGFRDFQPQSSSVPAYQGSTAAVNLTHIAFGTTRITGQVTRDVQYSYDINQPYYLLTGWNGSVSRRILGPVDGTARIGTQRLDYRDRTSVALAISNRTDHIYTYGGGLGYRMPRGVRLGFNVDHANRTSANDLRLYGGLTYGASVTYGL